MITIMTLMLRGSAGRFEGTASARLIFMVWKVHCVGCNVRCWMHGSSCQYGQSAGPERFSLPVYLQQWWRMLVAPLCYMSSHTMDGIPIAPRCPCQGLWESGGGGACVTQHTLMVWKPTQHWGPVQGRWLRTGVWMDAIACGLCKPLYASTGSRRYGRAEVAEHWWDWKGCQWEINSLSGFLQDGRDGKLSFQTSTRGWSFCDCLHHPSITSGWHGLGTSGVYKSVSQGPGPQISSCFIILHVFS